MQFGMIGLGRMGGNMVRRLMRDGHACVVQDVSPDAVAGLAKEGATGSSSIADFLKKLSTPRTVCLMVPAAIVDSIIDKLLPHLDRDDVIIDGGNPHYHDDIARTGCSTSSVVRSRILARVDGPSPPRTMRECLRSF
jgi:6-phosphogluconate dehydrogenase